MDIGLTDSGNQEVKEKVRVLLIEDNEDDAQLIRETMTGPEWAAFDLEWVELLSTGLERLASGEIDMVLLDLSLPDSHGLSTVGKVHSKASTVPIIVLTGLQDESVGVSAVQEGAQDYLVKGQVDRNLLLRAMRYAVERKQAENMKDRFFSSVTHDLRIPLTAMQGYLGLFRDGLYGDLSEKQMRVIVALSQASSSLLEMINSLLDFSKLRSGKYVPTMEPVDLEEVVNDVLEKITPLAEAKGLTLLRQFSQDFFPMKSDRRCLGQILMNLVGNAIKFTDHGSVKVSLKSVVKNSGIPAQMVQIRVEDTGCGIEARHLEKIFDEFYQVDMASQDTRPSTGLGLASCKRLAELLKGNVSVESKLGKGTTFSVMLPQEPLPG